MNDVKHILQSVRDGSVSVEEALLQIKQQPFEDIGYAKVDLHRKVRQGANEVIYGSGKTAEHIIGILDTMEKNGQKNVLITRLDKEKAEAIHAVKPLTYYETAKIAIAGEKAQPSGMGTISLISKSMPFSNNTIRQRWLNGQVMPEYKIIMIKSTPK